MTGLPSLSDPVFVNTLGHLAGAVVFAIFLYLFWMGRRQRGGPGYWLTAAAAVLALLWNLGSLLVLGLAEIPGANTELLVALTFSVLSLLPAVLLHVSLEGRLRLAWVTGYALSSVAVVLHAIELWEPAGAHHKTALLLITAGFGGLTLIVGAVLSLAPSERETLGRLRILGAMALFLFAMSFVHLGASHDQTAWAHELLLHHAGIPLALFVLLQDYRFLFLDVFVRFLANGVLAVAMALATVGIDPRFHLFDQEPHSVFLRGLGVGVFCLLLILFSASRRKVERWLTRAVFQRADLDASLREIRRHGAVAANENEFLARAASQAARFLNTPRFEVVDEPGLEHPVEQAAILPPGRESARAGSRTRPPGWSEVVVPLYPPGNTRYWLFLGSRRQGRRYLSEDMDSLNRIASAISEQVERIRHAQLERLVSQAELRALQAQINPHFLFNALNALYGIIPRSARPARQTVLNLAEIFRYSLEPNRLWIALSEELRIVRAYLAIEEVRLGDRLRTGIEVDEQALSVEIPVLSIQPLVENAVKHGAARRAEGGRVRLEIACCDGGLQVAVSDNGPGFDAARRSPAPGGGVGLENVRQRLELCYGPGSEIAIDSSAAGTTVRLLLGRAGPAAAGDRAAVPEVASPRTP